MKQKSICSQSYSMSVEMVAWVSGLS